MHNYFCKNGVFSAFFSLFCNSPTAKRTSLNYFSYICDCKLTSKLVEVKNEELRVKR